MLFFFTETNKLTLPICNSFVCNVKSSSCYFIHCCFKSFQHIHTPAILVWALRFFKVSSPLISWFFLPFLLKLGILHFDHYVNLDAQEKANLQIRGSRKRWCIIDVVLTWCHQVYLIVNTKPEVLSLENQCHVLIWSSTTFLSVPFFIVRSGMKTFVKNRRRENNLIQLGKELVISQKMF